MDIVTIGEVLIVSQISLPNGLPAMYSSPNVKRSLSLSTRPFMTEKFIPVTNWMADGSGQLKK